MKDFNQKTIIINLFGGPGSGKSTTAAALFAKLKLRKINCELVSEYAKSLVWEERHKTFENQFYISAKQDNYLFRLLGKVEVVINDSPLLLGIFYNPEEDPILNSFLLNRFGRYNNVNIFINRVKEYNKIGRNQTLKEANEASLFIKMHILDRYNLPYIIVDGDENASDTIIKHMEYKGKLPKKYN